MHKKLASDLTSLAHSILQMKNKEDVHALKEKAYALYEKLTVLAYVEDYINTTPQAEETKEELVEKIEKAEIRKAHDLELKATQLEEELVQEITNIEEVIEEEELIVEEATQEVEIQEETIDEEIKASIEEIEEEVAIVAETTTEEVENITEEQEEEVIETTEEAIIDEKIAELINGEEAIIEEVAEIELKEPTPETVVEEEERSLDDPLDKTIEEVLQQKEVHNLDENIEVIELKEDEEEEEEITVIEQKINIVDNIEEQPFDELENLLFGEEEFTEVPVTNEIVEEETLVEEEELVEDKLQPTLEDELKDTLPVDVMADLFQKVEPKKTVNDHLQTTIQIGLNDRIAFVKHLFDNDQTDFNRVVSQLNTFKTEEEAKKFISRMVKPDYDWSEKEEYEKRFLEIIERKFA